MDAESLVEDSKTPDLRMTLLTSHQGCLLSCIASVLLDTPNEALADLWRCGRGCTPEQSLLECALQYRNVGSV